MASDRRTLLADAALDVLADEGVRGLTHRAVDRKAAMPPGTTSAYFRTRAALLTGLVRRLVQLDQAELQTMAEELPPLRTAEELVDGMVLLARQRLTGEGRRRSLATPAPSRACVTVSCARSSYPARTPAVMLSGCSSPRTA
jgi:DNA-binding transcriptional regulator YbjK